MRSLSKRSSASLVLAIALAASIVLGIAVAWTRQFWSIAVMHTALLLTMIASVFLKSPERPPWIGIFPAVIGTWGWVQIWFTGSALRLATRSNAIEWSVTAATFLLTAQLLRDGHVRSIFLVVLMWASGIFSLLAILQMYSAPNLVFWWFPAQELAVGTFLYKNQFAAMIELAIPIALYMMLFKKDRFWSGLAVFLTLFAGVIASASRAGVALSLFESLVLLLLAWRAGRIPLSTVLTAVPGTLLVLGCTAAIAGSEVAFHHFQEVGTDMVRQELAKSTVQMIRDAPWSGYGLGTWSVIYPKYASFDVGRFANAAHNDWLEWMSDGGFIFAGSFAAMFLVLARRAFAHPWCLGIFSICLHSWVDYPTREPVLAIFWFSLAGALVAASNTREHRHARQ